MDVGDHLSGIGLVPAAIELLGGNPELDYEVAGQILGLDLTPLLPPQPDQRRLVVVHNDPGVRAADERPAVMRLYIAHFLGSHFN